MESSDKFIPTVFYPANYLTVRDGKKGHLYYANCAIIKAQIVFKLPFLSVTFPKNIPSHESVTTNNFQHYFPRFFKDIFF